MYMCICTHTYIHIFPRHSHGNFGHMCIYVYMYIYSYICTCICIYPYICKYIPVDICIFIHIFTHSYIYTCLYTCTYRYRYKFIYLRFCFVLQCIVTAFPWWGSTTHFLKLTHTHTRIDMFRVVKRPHPHSLSLTHNGEARRLNTLALRFHSFVWYRVPKTHRMPCKLQVEFHKRATNYSALAENNL